MIESKAMEPQMSVDMGGLWKVEGLVDIGWARGRVAAGIRPAAWRQG